MELGWVESKLAKLDALDVERLMGSRNLPGSVNLKRKESSRAATATKFSRRNDGVAVDAARARFLARKKAANSN
eukprot:SAG31_NODE_2211_length_6179_cov_2.919572_4_plen_74_part_00